MTTKQTISDWFDTGTQINADFMLVVCDTYTHEDYPVYCTKEEFDERYAHYNGKNMQQIMEVYDLSMSKDDQLAETIVLNLPVV